jgi:hypothetical protein
MVIVYQCNYASRTVEHVSMNMFYILFACSLKSFGVKNLIKRNRKNQAEILRTTKTFWICFYLKLLAVLW